MKTERLAKLTNLRSYRRGVLGGTVNGAYVYRRYIQSGDTVSFSCAGLYNSPFSFSHVRKCFVLCVSSTRSSFCPHVASIQMNDRNVYSSHVFSYVHVIVAQIFSFLSKSKKQDQHKYVIASYTKFCMLFFTRMDFGLLRIDF